MAGTNKKLTSLTTLSSTPASGDYFYVVDVSDTSGGTSGTSKKIAFSDMSSGGGAVSTLPFPSLTQNVGSIDTIIVIPPGVSQITGFIVAVTNSVTTTGTVTVELYNTTQVQSVGTVDVPVGQLVTYNLTMTNPSVTTYDIITPQTIVGDPANPGNFRLQILTA